MYKIAAPMDKKWWKKSKADKTSSTLLFFSHFVEQKAAKESPF
jgi:hypothetical protein